MVLSSRSTILPPLGSLECSCSMKCLDHLGRQSILENSKEVHRWLVIWINAEVFQLCSSLIETTPPSVSDQKKKMEKKGILSAEGSDVAPQFNPVLNDMLCCISGRKLVSALPVLTWMLNIFLFLPFLCVTLGSFLEFVCPAMMVTRVGAVIFILCPHLQMQLWAHTAKAVWCLVRDHSLKSQSKYLEQFLSFG